jgi:hypothetical protein
MNTPEERHLNENQIVMAVVDCGLLPAAMHTHLSACRHCQSQKIDIERQFFELGQRARELAPLPQKSPRLPVAASKSPIWRYLPASAFSVLLLSAIAWWGIFSSPPARQSLSPVQSASGAWEDEGFMTEISTLSENALSDEYTQLAATADAAELDEDFFEYVVPSTDAQPLSEEQKIKGGRLC